MTTDSTLPDTIDWTNTEDTIGLLEWLDSHPAPPTVHELPSAPYGIKPDDTSSRAAGGLLAIYQHLNDYNKAITLIHRLLREDLKADKLNMLLGKLKEYEDQQRQLSLDRLAAFSTNNNHAFQSLPEYLPTIPHFEHFITDTGDHGVIFAVEITAALPTRVTPPIEAACADLLLALHHATDHIADRYGLGVDVRFDWRYISQHQLLTIAFMVRISGLASREAGEQAASVLWFTIDGLLPLNRTLYTYSPVTQPERLAWLRTPGPLASAFAITRQEHTFEHADKEIYSIGLLATGTGDHHALIAEMLRQPGISVVDIQIKPTHWQHNERDAVRRFLNTEWLNQVSNQSESIDTMLHPLEDKRYLRTLETYLNLLNYDLMFETWVTVASTEMLAATALPIVTALNLYGTSRYEIRPAILDEEQKAAMYHLYHLSGTRWFRSQAPAGLERLIQLLTPDETLASTRLPTPGTSGVPGVAVQKIKITPLPPGLPAEDLLIGDAYDPTLNRQVPIYSNGIERTRHMYIVGRTGTGKSTLLENMALQDIYAGRGVGIIDPHGDLVEAILARIPANRIQDVILFDPSAADRPVGLNILDVEGDFEKNMVISEFMGLMYSIYDPGRTGIVGPRFEQAVRNAMHTAMTIKDSTLIDVMRILSNNKYARACLEFVTDPMVRSYYKDIIDGQSDFHKSEVLDYITSKFGRFTGDTAIRNIIGQARSTINFNDVMNEGKILLVNLSKGHIGQENSRFLGLLLVPRILIAAFSRARQPANQRKPFYLYVDEFHNFTTPMFSTMLSEGRKYGLVLTLANQFISQLTTDIRESVFGNVGTLGVFQVGVKDAGLLAQELYPVFEVDDLVNFPAFHMAMKMPLGGAAGRPFMLKTRDSAIQPNLEMAAAVKHHSLLHYGRDTAVIDAELRSRFDIPPEGRPA